MAESVYQSQGEALVPQLSYRMPQDAARYMISRREISSFPSGNSFGPAGVRTMRIDLGGGGAGFADLSSLAIQMTFHNDDAAKSLTPLTCGAHCLVNRIRLYCSGTLVEEVQYAGRITEGLERFLPEDKRENLAAMGFGKASGSFTAGNPVATSIVASGSKKIIYQPSVLGMVQQKCYIPLFAVTNGSIQLEIELSNADDAVVTAADGSNSVAWHLSDVRAHMDVFQCSHDMTESLVKHIASGKTLLLPFRGTSVTSQAVASSGDISVHVSRAFSRLTHVAVSFMGATTGTRSLHLKETNDYFSSNYNGGTIQDTITARLQIGDYSKPDSALNCTTNMYRVALQTMGILNSACHATSVSLEQYQGRESGAYQPAFQILHDTEVSRFASATGFNTSHGGLITEQVQGISGASKCFVTCSYDGVLEIGMDSAAVLS